MRELDDGDRKILRHWQKDPNQSMRVLADDVGMSFSVLVRRIDRLRADGIVRGRRAIIDPQALEHNVRVFLRITLDKTVSDALGLFVKAAKQIDEIEVIETLVGRVDVRMDVVARDLGHFQRIYADKVLNLPHIQDIESLILISEVKNDDRLPL